MSQQPLQDRYKVVYWPVPGSNGSPKLPAEQAKCIRAAAREGREPAGYGGTYRDLSGPPGTTWEGSGQTHA